MTSDRRLDLWIWYRLFDPTKRTNAAPNFTSDMNEAVKVLNKLEICLRITDAGAVFYYHEDDLFYDRKDILGYLTDIDAYQVCVLAYKVITGKEWE